MGLQAGSDAFADQIVMNLQRTSLAGTPMRTPIRRGLPGLFQCAGFHRRLEHGRQLSPYRGPQAIETMGEESSTPPIDVVAVARIVASIREYESPLASIGMTRVRLASSDRILRLRTRRSSSARSSVVNVSAICRDSVPALLHRVQGAGLPSKPRPAQTSSGRSPPCASSAS